MTETSVNTEIVSVDRTLLWQAAELLVSTQFGSRAMLQRKLRITWQQTALVMDAMESLGVIGPVQGAEGRTVLIKVVEDLEPVEAALSTDQQITVPTAREAPGPAAMPHPAPDAVPELPGGAADFEKTAPAPGPRPPAEDQPEPEPEHQGRGVEGTVYTADEWELREDPEGDRPWIDPALRTAEGRRARAKYVARQARRRARKAAARQRTVHGFVPRVLRGERRLRAWVVGVEGAKARADVNLALATVREANRAARRAGLSIVDRKVKRAAGVALQQEAGKQLAVAEQTTRTAHRKIAFRAGVTYGPVLAADLAVAGFTNVWGFLGALALNLAGASWAGRDVELTEEQLERLERIEDGMPQQVEVGMTPRAFEAMMRQALTEDLAVTLSALRVDPYAWGFEVHVWLDRMSPKKITDGLETLESCLPGVRTSSVLLRQSAASRNYCVIVVPGPNAWDAVPELPYRAPKSLTTKDISKAQVAAAMSGQSLGLPMCRTNVNLVGASRSGKSTWLRAVLDALTATGDQIVIGIDLGSAGSGFAGMRRAMHLTVTDPFLAADVLDWVLAVGQGRPDLFDELGMGQNWRTSPSRPGVKVIIDEFPALVKASRTPLFDDEGKKTGELDLDGKLQEMSITCAKSDVTLVVAGQGLTRALIGKNTWLTELPVQVMCACDVDDLKLILHAGAMDEGWRPNRLVPAMGDEINDASVAYVLAGALHSEPLLYRACITADEEYERRGAERAAAGLAEMDEDSEEFCNTTLAELIERAAKTGRRRRRSGPPRLIKLIREIFDAAGDPAGMACEQLAGALGEADPDRFGLDNFASEGDTVKERVTAQTDAVRTAINLVLDPTDHTWPLEKYSKSLPRGYRLRDLKVITGETPKAP